jgi:hypothetical protein
MGKESNEMEFDDGKTYWPGTDIVKSPNNAFSLDHDGPHIDWAKEMVNAGSSAKITADVERRRKAGRDPGAFYGISKKADEMIRHGGAYTRARSKPKVESKSARMRALLATGPKNSLELGAFVGVPPKHARALLKYDVEQKNVVILRDKRPFRYALAEAA